MPNTDKHDQISPQQEVVCSPQLDRSALAKLLDEWMQGDETEQRETFEVLRRFLQQQFAQQIPRED